jgi:hypothetical protein
MTKRYFGDLDNYAESDIVIIGAGKSYSSTQDRMVSLRLPTSCLCSCCKVTQQHTAQQCALLLCLQ